MCACSRNWRVLERRREKSWFERRARPSLGGRLWWAGGLAEGALPTPCQQHARASRTSWGTKAEAGQREVKVDVGGRDWTVKGRAGDRKRVRGASSAALRPRRKDPPADGKCDVVFGDESGCPGCRHSSRVSHGRLIFLFSSV